MNNDFVYINENPPYYQSKLFIKHGVRHCFFTRKGGVSKGVFESLNFAEGNGDIKDDTKAVLENYRIAASVFGLEAGDICRSYQTHTSTVEIADNSLRGTGVTKPRFEHGVDGLVTAEKDLLLSVRTADCVPILLYDTKAKICGAVHSGWRGTAGGISKNAVLQMESLGGNRENIIAAIGPCIGSCCYEVGAEVLGEFASVDAEFKKCFLPKGEKYMLDLNLANEIVLLSSGILPENISVANLCTKCREEEFYSHRRNGVNRGTLGAFICI